MLADKIQGQAQKLDFFMKELVRSSYMETDMIVVTPADSLGRRTDRQGLPGSRSGGAEKEDSDQEARRGADLL